ncbi:MAG: asparagine synthase (glutamine-hydrolyzing) [Casimicrobiaceae bacterium]
MCGITGFVLNSPSQSEAALTATVLAQAATIVHRGPDDDGSWVDAASGVALGFRRLSIVDLSPAGHQPMRSHNGRYVMVFNGEIYNYGEFRSAIEREASAAQGAIAWRGHSDTEALLEAIVRYGITGALQRCVGMFALAVWDRELRQLTLGRDRFGEKPLYYGFVGGDLAFGSELKTLVAHPGWKGEIDREALTAYLRFAYVPHARSIYRGIHKLPPGTTLTFRLDDAAKGRLPEPQSYWSATDAINAAKRDPFRGSDVEAVDELERLLRQSVRGQMVADVPLGAFLSGGVDSSTIVALMQAQSSQPVRTFSIGFREDAYNEAEYAKAVARHLGTDHTELYVTSKQALDVIPRLPAIYDEPFADSSQIPTFLVSQLARRHVTVSLSGDAGDELFGGYNRYLFGRRNWDRISSWPRGLRSAAAMALRAPSPGAWNRVFAILDPILPQAARVQLPGDKLHKLARWITAPTPEALYAGLVAQIDEPDSVAVHPGEAPNMLGARDAWPQLDDLTERMMYLDAVSYLPDDILVKVDRAAMAVSLETRVPMLDHRVAEFAWSLPLHMKIRDGRGKHVLRQVLDRHIPAALVDRPKMGFSVPVDEWLRGPLRDWAEALLDPARLTREGYLRAAPVRKKWDEHQSGRRNWSYWLWTVLMFQAWLEAQRVGEAAAL